MDYLSVNTELREINSTLNKILTEINKKFELNSLKILEIGIGNDNKSIPIAQKNKFKTQLEECYSDILNSNYLYKIDKDNKYCFLYLKLNKIIYKII